MDIKKAEKIAVSLIKKHLNTEWNFRFDKSPKFFGSCYHNKKLITISKVLTQLNSKEEFLETVLHEIAHAICGPKVAHGEKWKKIARLLGCSTESHYGENVILPSPKWRGICPCCDHVWYREKRLDYSCSYCVPDDYDPDYKLIWIRND